MISGCARAFCALILVIGCGCTGEVDVIHDAEGNEWTPGAFTYNQLVRATAHGQSGNHIVDWNGTEVQADKIDSRFSLQEQLKVVTVSKAHLGDLDFVSKALKKKRGDFIVTVEATGGAVLTSVPMGKQEILVDEQLKKKDVKHETTIATKIEVPPEIAGPGTHFRGGLFACIDTDRDGSCADEVVNKLDSDKASQNVIFFAGVKGTIKGQGATGRTVELYRATASEVGSPDWIMVQVLKNLPSEDGQGALTVHLAVGVIGNKVKGLDKTGPNLSAEELVMIHKAQITNHKKRTNGCFVRGTRILLASGDALRVEDVFAGVEVTTAKGRRLEVLESVAGPERHPIVAIRTDAGHSLRVTRSHPMLTPSGLRMANDLAVGHRLIAAGHRVVRIVSLKREPYSDLVFNFSLPGGAEADHLVNAEGLITGDLHLQQKLSR
jgi:hypothetical protein